MLATRQTKPQTHGSHRAARTPPTADLKKAARSGPWLFIPPRAGSQHEPDCDPQGPWLPCALIATNEEIAGREPGQIENMIKIGHRGINKQSWRSPSRSEGRDASEHPMCSNQQRAAGGNRPLRNSTAGTTAPAAEGGAAYNARGVTSRTDPNLSLPCMPVET